jgi:hypothetical protein
MNLYLNLLDDFVREEGENNSIGIILCADKDKFEVEYALRGFEKQMGVAEYKLTKELQGAYKYSKLGASILFRKYNIFLVYLVLLKSLCAYRRNIVFLF